MTKKKGKFASVWVKQTQLGNRFGMSAVAIGRKLKELGLKGDDNAPTRQALEEGYARYTPLRDGTPFYLWNIDKASALLRELGLQTISRSEQQAREFARELASRECQARTHPEAEKEAYLLLDVIPEHLVDRVKRLLAEMPR